MKITNLTGRVIKDSRGEPTIEVQLVTEAGEYCASIPSGKSTGVREAVSLPVKDALHVLTYRVAPVLVGRVFTSSDEVDTALCFLDDAHDKRNIGGNTTLGVSIAASRACATEHNVPLWKYISEMYDFSPSVPRLYANVLNGGLHANFLLPFQEYIIVPKEKSAQKAYHAVKKYFTKLGDVVGTARFGDEGGYVPRYKTLEEPFDVLESVVGSGADIAIDAAASAFNRGNMYMLLNESYQVDELRKIYENITAPKNFLSIEDPFAEDEIQGFKKLTKAIGNTTLVVGDDLTVTNPTIVKKMITEKACNALIVKPNQIGTLKETCEAVRLAQDAGWKCIASHRSGETMDTFIADLAVGIGAFGIKAGAPSQKERVVKYERLIEIEKEYNKII